MSCARCAATPKREEPAPRRQRARSGIVQRKCGGGCDGEHREAARPGQPASDLRPTLPGKALAPETRAWFERRLGHDLGRVRIHDDPGSAAAARGVGALAYTLGRDIAFASGGYRPDDHAGRQLLAHELAHVVQQGAAPRLGDAGGPVPAAAAPQRKPELGPPGDAFEREADRVAHALAAGQPARPMLRAPAAAQAQPAPGGLMGRRLRAPALPPPPILWPGSIREAWVIPDPPALPRLEPPTAPLGWRPRLLPEAPEFQLDPSLRRTPVRIIPVPRRVPDRTLTWADFPRNNPPSNFGAETVFTHPRIIVDGNPMFQARLSDASSVRPKFRTPADRTTNGCAPTVANCTRGLATPGFWFTQRPTPDSCPAGVSPTCPRPDPCDATAMPPCGNPAVGCIIETQSDCADVYGPACDAAAVAESARLLAHEQLHFDIVWKLVGRANDALIGGTHTAAVLDQWLSTHITAQTRLYDSHAQTDHGCNAASQASWTADVAAGLQSVALPPANLTPPTPTPPPPAATPPTPAPPPPVSLVPPGPF